MADKQTTVKKSVSFRGDVFKTAEAMADKYFGGNFSAYLTYLICADKHGVSRVMDTEEDVAIKEEIKEGISNNYVKSDDNEDYIDALINLKPKE